MKLTCTQENLNQGLFVVSHITSKNINLPILSNVLLEAKDGVLKLATTNLEIGITCVVRGKIETEGSFTVQSKLFSDFIGLLPSDKVEVEVKDQSLVLKCQKSKTKIKGQEAAEFPLIPKINKKEPFVCGVNSFVNAVSQVIFAVSGNETRPEIGGVFFNFNKNSLVLAATDSYRLAEKVIETKKTAKEEASVIVPTRTLQELLRILSGLKRAKTDTAEAEENTDNLEIYLGENQILFSFDNIELISRTIEGQYPNYRQIIPTEYKTRFIAEAGAFGKAVKTASLFSKSGVFDVNFEIFKKDKEAEVSAVNSQTGEGSARFETEVEGEDNKIVINYRYLLDGLQNIGSEKVIFEMTNDASPCILRQAREENGEAKVTSGYLYIIMPIKQ